MVKKFVYSFYRSAVSSLKGVSAEVETRLWWRRRTDIDSVCAPSCLFHGSMCHCTDLKPYSHGLWDKMDWLVVWLC